MSRFRGVLFDLDDTLFDCTGQLTEPAKARAARILSEHASLPENALISLQTNLSDTLGSSGAIRELGSRFQIPDNVVELALTDYNRDEVPEIQPYPDAIATLEAISQQGLKLLCVTTGRQKRQIAKVDRLSLSDYFSTSENLFVHEPDDSYPDKEAAMRQALGSLKLVPAETLCIGDKLDADVQVANRIGMRTVRIKKGRQRNVAPSGKDDTPDYEIDELAELSAIISKS